MTRKWNRTSREEQEPPLLGAEYVRQAKVTPRYTLVGIVTIASFLIYLRSSINEEDYPEENANGEDNSLELKKRKSLSVDRLARKKIC